MGSNCWRLLSAVPLGAQLPPFSQLLQSFVFLFCLGGQLLRLDHDATTTTTLIIFGWCAAGIKDQTLLNSLHVFRTLHSNLDPVVRVLHKIIGRLTYSNLKLLLMCSMLPLRIFISYCAQVFAIYVVPVKKIIKGTVALEPHQPQSHQPQAELP